MRTFIVGFSGRSTYLTVTVEANNEKEAIEKADDEITLQFTSEDEITDCEVRHYNYDAIEEMKM